VASSGEKRGKSEGTPSMEMKEKTYILEVMKRNYHSITHTCASTGVTLHIRRLVDTLENRGKEGVYTCPGE